MLTMLSYTQNVWTVGFRPLIMLEIHGSTIHNILVACVVLMEAMLPCFNLKPDDCNLATTQTLSIT